MAATTASRNATGGIGGPPPALVPYGIICGQAQKSLELDARIWDEKRLRKRQGWRIASALRRYEDTKCEGWLLESCQTVSQHARTSDGGDVLELTYHCRHRLCPECRKIRATAWARRLAPYLQAGTYQVDGNGHFPKSEPELQAAAHKFGQMVEVDSRVGLPERMAARMRKLDRAAETHEETLYPLFMTLTVPNVPKLWEEIPVGNGLKSKTCNHLDERIYQPFRRLRETARRRPGSVAGQFMQWIAGGVWTVECTYNPRTGYHPHLHAIVWSRRRFLHPAALRRVWATYAPGATVVDIRAVSPALAADAVKEVGDEMRGSLALYMLGGMAKKREADGQGESDFQERRYSPEVWHQLAAATKNKKLVNRFGLLREMPEPVFEDGAPGAEVEPTTQGVHYLARWDRAAQKFRVVAEWPASPEDPICSMKQRIAAGQDIAAAMRAMDRRMAHDRPIQETRLEISRARWRLTLRGSVPWHGRKRPLTRLKQ